MAGCSFPRKSSRSASTRSSPTAPSATCSTCRRGYWEAKDTDDDLDAEISKKIAKGYPLNNTIFEDTRQAVLFQGGVERYRARPDRPQATLPTCSTSSTPTPSRTSRTFDQAVEEFKEPRAGAGQGPGRKIHGRRTRTTEVPGGVRQLLHALPADAQPEHQPAPPSMRCWCSTC